METRTGSELLGTNYLFAVEETDVRDELHVPRFAFEATDDDDYASLVYRYFQTVWDHNGYIPIRSPHTDVLATPADSERHLPFILVNSYRGLTDGQVLDRKPYLKAYRRERAVLDTLREPNEQEQQRQKLERILNHVPDLAGLQGVQTYRLIIPRNRTARDYRLSGGRGLTVSRSYHLGPEMSKYNLPATDSSKPIYPYLPPVKPELFIDGERYVRKGHPGELLEDYQQRWQRLLSLIEPVLRQEVSFD